MTVVSPGADFAGSENERGVVLRLTWKGRGLALLTADIGRRAIKDMLRRGEILTASAVTAPHHGSAGSVVPELYDRVKPEFVLASAGRGNQWGFPSPAVREQAERLGAAFHDTPESGAVTLTWEDARAAPRIETEREEGGSLGIRTRWFWARSWP